MPQCWCCLATNVWKKSRLNWKLKVSNAADNADITQSQARDSRHHRMQEVNSLCTDNGPLRANTVLCHSTQYSLLICSHCNGLMCFVSYLCTYFYLILFFMLFAFFFILLLPDFFLVNKDI